MKYVQILKNGVVDQNPTFVQLLALCPTLGVTISVVNSLTMGLVTSMVLIVSCIIVSIFRKFIVNEVRIGLFVIVTASLVAMIEYSLKAYGSPELNESLGIFVPLIVVNCILFARIEVFAAKNKVLPTIVDAFGMGLGFTIGLTSLGIVREVLGSGSFLGIPLIHDESKHVLIMVMAPGAFFTLGGIIMVKKAIEGRSKK